MTQYAFLSQPPPQKKRPTQRLPPLPSPTTICPPIYRSSISSWALAVQPGSPPPSSPRSPRSPRRRPSLSSPRRPSFSHRRPSVSHGQAPSGSFLYLIDTPTTTSGHRTTPSVKDFDLTNLGYTSVFVHLPKTPSTPTSILAQNSDSFAQIPISSALPPPKLHKRFRSLGMLKPLRSRVRSKSVAPSSPTKSTTTKSAKSILVANKAKYAAVASPKKSKSTRPLPPTLANELLLMQFLDGGSLNSHAQSVMQAQAKQVGSNAGVGDVFRDENGNMWWDQDEEWEYAHLLGGDKDVDASPGWEKFTDDDKENVDGERRGSVSTQDSDLEDRFLLPTEEADDGLAAFGASLAPLVSTKPAMSVLALPPRSRRYARHFQKGIDLEAFAFSESAGNASGSREKQRKHGKGRRRPAPLNLTPVSLPARPFNETEDVRQEFLGDSFTPVPLQSTSVAGLKRTRKAIMKKPSRLNVKALFSRN